MCPSPEPDNSPRTQRPEEIDTMQPALAYEVPRRA
jgi:hypothetical protein